jgi:hypothetical protein
VDADLYPPAIALLLRFPGQNFSTENQEFKGAKLKEIKSVKAPGKYDRRNTPS